jgi:hypothetical protein
MQEVRNLNVHISVPVATGSGAVERAPIAAAMRQIRLALNSMCERKGWGPK